MGVFYIKISRTACVVLTSATLFACGSSPCLPLPGGDCARKEPTPETPDSAGGPADRKGDRGLAITRAEDLDAVQGELNNLDAILASSGLGPWQRLGHRGQGVTIAVLDNGFAGLNRSRGIRLPPDLTVETAPRPEMQTTAHGTRMAEIAYAVATGGSRYDAGRPGPRILLMNTNGYTNFKAAIDQVVARRPDIVLYSQVWEYGGNGDGDGFINREVDRAVAAGVLWLNAAGNLGQSTYSGPVSITASGDVRLPHADRYVRFSVPVDGTAARVALVWNDFDDAKDYQTSQDLDLVLESPDGQVIAVSRLIQDGSGGRMTDTSAHARELIQTRLAAGVYRVRVEAVSRNFDRFSRLRLTVEGAGITMLDRTDENSVLIPADNTGVLTIGASDTADSGRRSAAAGQTGKPELLLRSEVTFTSGEKHYGSSAATAIAAGAAAVLKGSHGLAGRDAWVEALRGDALAGPAGSADCGFQSADIPGTGLLRPCAAPVLKIKPPAP